MGYTYDMFPVQVSHQGNHIRGGFCSGAATDAPSAYMNQFQYSGVCYYISSGISKAFGAVVVSSQPKVGAEFNVYVEFFWRNKDFNGLVQERSIFSELAMEILQSCNKPSIYLHFLSFFIEMALFDKTIAHGSHVRFSPVFIFPLKLCNLPHWQSLQTVEVVNWLEEDLHNILPVSMARWCKSQGYLQLWHLPCGGVIFWALIQYKDVVLPV